LILQQWGNAGERLIFVSSHLPHIELIILWQLVLLHVSGKQKAEIYDQIQKYEQPMPILTIVLFFGIFYSEVT
jgi:hypothetical protein